MSSKVLDVFSIIGLICAIIAVPSSIGFIISRIKNRKNLSWRKIKEGIKYLVTIVQELDPDIVITFSGRGSIVANLIFSEIENKYPLYTCLLKSRQNDFFLEPKTWSSFNTNKWIVYVPNEVFMFKDKKILIIDDILESGNTITKLTQHLIKNDNIDEAKIFCMTLIAKDEHKDLLYAQWRTVKTSDYNVPWNKTKNNSF